MRHLEAERAVAVQPKRAAVEDELVLPADLIGEDKRQPGLNDARHGDLHALVRLVAPVGRAVRHDEKLCAGLRQAVDDFRLPDVLADGKPEPDAAEVDRPGERARLEDAKLVENAVVRQLHLVANRRDLAAIEEKRAVVEARVIDPWRADDNARPRTRLLCERLRRRAARRLHRRLQGQVFGRVAEQE